MNNWKKIIVCIFVICAFVLFGVLVANNFNFRTLTTDSGFDSSWDSGSSSGGGYSSSGGGYSSSSSSGGSIGLEGYVWFIIVFVPTFYYLSLFLSRFNTNTIYRGWKGGLKASCFVFLFCVYGAVLIFSIFYPAIHIIRWIIFVIVLIYMKRKYNTFIKGYNPHNFNNVDKFVRKDVSDDIFTKYKLSDKDILKKEFYDIYVKIQKAWSNNDIEKARDVLSDNLFNMYKTQILTMVNKNQRNAMSDFEFVSAYINDVNVNKDVMTVKVMMEVYCKDYLIDIKTDKVLRGDRNRINHYYYLLSFTKDIEADDNTCPNCGAKISSSKSAKCEHCDAVINKKSNKFVLSNKKMIKQEVGRK